MAYLFTSESVSEGHPDKVADQISDALLDNFLAQDPNSKVACETLVTTGLTVLSGEVTTKAYIDVQKIAREVILKIGYNKSEYQFDGDSCGVISAIHEQSPDINQGVVEGKGLNKEQCSILKCSESLVFVQELRIIQDILMEENLVKHHIR